MRPVDLVVWCVVRKKFAGEPGPRYNLYGMPNNVIEGICEEVVEVFTQTHYETIAKTLGSACIRADEANSVHGRQAIIDIVNDLCTVFENDNPKFKKLRFIEAALGKANAMRKTKEE